MNTYAEERRRAVGVVVCGKRRQRGRVGVGRNPATTVQTNNHINKH